MGNILRFVRVIMCGEISLAGLIVEGFEPNGTYLKEICHYNQVVTNDLPRASLLLCPHKNKCIAMKRGE